MLPHRWPQAAGVSRAGRVRDGEYPPHAPRRLDGGGVSDSCNPRVGRGLLDFQLLSGSLPVWSQAVPLHTASPLCFHFMLRGRAGVLVSLVPMLAFSCSSDVERPLPVLSPALKHPPSAELWTVSDPESICLVPSLGLGGLMEMLVGLVEPGAQHQVNARQAGPAWTLAVGRCPLGSGLGQPSEHPASLAGSSCAHAGSHPLSGGAISSQPWQAASRHRDFLLNATGLRGLVCPLNCIITSELA